MIRSSERATMRPRNKLLALAAAILLLAVGYTLAWTFLAGELRQRVTMLIGGLADENISADCRDLDVRGYPFRLGVFCESVRAERTAGAPLTVTTGPLRSAAQIYRPNHIVSELDGPASVETATESLAADWEVLRASTVFSTSGLSRVSAEARMLAAEARPNALGAPVALQSDDIEFHARRNNGNGLDLALRAENARLSGGALASSLPAFGVVGEATIDDGAAFLDGRAIDRAALRGTSGRIANAALAIGEDGVIRVSGPFDISAAGRISGRFDIEIVDMAAWTATAREAFPALAANIENAANLLRSLEGRDGALSATLNVDEGRVSFGIIPLARLPAI